MNENANEPKPHQPYWKRLYNGLAIWVCLYLMLIASGFYIIASDFSFKPHEKTLQPKNFSNALTNPTNDASKMKKPNTNNRSKTMIAGEKGLLAIDEK